jgi:hypothetical protein
MKNLLFSLLIILVFTNVKAQSNYEQMARNIIADLNLSLDYGPVYNVKQDAFMMGAEVSSNLDYASIKNLINGFLYKYNDIQIIRNWEWNDSRSYSIMISKMSIKNQVTLYIAYFPDEKKLTFGYK